MDIVTNPVILTPVSGIITVDGSRGDHFQFSQSANAIVSIQNVRPGQTVYLYVESSGTFTLSTDSVGQTPQFLGGASGYGSFTTSTVYELTGLAGGSVVTVAQVSGQSGGLPWPEEDFSALVTVDRNATSTVGFGTSQLFFRLAPSGNTNGAQKRIRVPAYSAPSIVFAADLNQSGDTWDLEHDLIVEITYSNDRAVTKTYFAESVPDSNPPILLWAHLLLANPDIVELAFNQEVSIASLAGITLPGSTISYVIQPRLDLTKIRFRLAAPLASTVGVSFTFTSANTIFDGRNNQLRAQDFGVNWRATPEEATGKTLWQDGSEAINTAGQWPALPTSASQAALIQQAFDDSRRPAQNLLGYDGAPTLDFDGVLVSALAGDDTFTTSGNQAVDFTLDMPLEFFVQTGTSPNTLPGGITAKTTYYARDITSSTFKVAATAGGAAVNITADSVGQVYCRFQTLLGTSNWLGGADPLITQSEHDVWVAFVPKAIPTDATASVYINDSPLGGQQGFDTHVSKGAGADTCTVVAMIRDTGGLWQTAATPCQERQPMLVRNKHEGGQLSITRDHNATVSVACGDLLVASWACSPGSSRAGDQGFLWTSLMFIAACSEAQSDIIAEGIKGHCESQEWGSFLRPDFALPPMLYCLEGVEAELGWEQVCLSPTPLPTTAALSQFSFAATGITGATVNTTKLLWTPAAGDIGEHELKVAISRDSKVVANAWGPVTVAPATQTGTVRVLLVGDSWTDADLLGVQLYQQIAATGLTVVMLGSRGGQSYTVAFATNIFTANSHGYSDGQAVDTYTLTGVLPTPLTAGVTYYARDTTLNTFKLALTPGGAEINITADGSGTRYVRAPYERNEGRGGYSWNNFVLGTQPSPFINTDGVCDASYYVANSLAAVVPTHTIYQLGINGVLNGGISPDNPLGVQAVITTAAIAPAEVLIHQFQDIDATMAQGVLLPSAPNILQSSFQSTYGFNHWRWGWRRTQNRLARRYASQFYRPDERVYCPDAFGIDTGTDFDPVDPAHPYAAGYLKVAKRLAAWVCATKL